MATTTPYQSTIRGNFMSVYRPYFPLKEIAHPPEGWAFRRVTEWRRLCADRCWRIVYVRAPLSGDLTE